MKIQNIKMMSHVQSMRKMRRFRAFFFISIMAFFVLCSSSIYLIININPTLLDAFDRKIFNQSQFITSEIQSAVNLGISLDDMIGWDEYFEELAGQYDSLLGLTVFKKESGVVYDKNINITSNQNLFSWALDFVGFDRVRTQKHLLYKPNSNTSNNDTIGQVALVYDYYYALNLINSMLYDILTILIVVWVLLYELRHFVLYIFIQKPVLLTKEWLSRNQQGVKSYLKKAPLVFKNYFKKLVTTKEKGAEHIELKGVAEVRFFVFLFMMAIEMCRTFLPLVIEEAFFNNPSEVPFPLPVVSAMPVVGFMALSLLGAFLGYYILKAVNTKTFLLTCAVITSFFISMVVIFTKSIGAITLVWMIVGLFYAFVIIGVQNYLINAHPQLRGQNPLIYFAQAVFSALIIGPMLGGFVADYWGYDALFLLSFILFLGSCFVAIRFLSRGNDTHNLIEEADSKDAQQIHSIDSNAEKKKLSIFIHVQFWLFSLPSKMVLSGVLFFALPIQLNELSYDKLDIGRLIMNYGIAMVIFLPFINKMVSQNNSFIYMLFLLFVSVLLNLISFLMFKNSIAYIIFAIFLFGFAQLISVVIQPVLITRFCNIYQCSLPRSLSVYRTMERLGALIGPVVVALLSFKYGYFSIIHYLGVIIFIMGIVCIAWLSIPYLTNRKLFIKNYAHKQ